jgi:hypothetical protein
MLARLSRGLAPKGAGAKSALKFRFEVQVDKLENLPSAVKRCRVVWSRGSKLQMTAMQDVRGGALLARSRLQCARLALRRARRTVHLRAFLIQHPPSPLNRPPLGVAKFRETLTLVATLYKHPVSAFEAKVRRRGLHAHAPGAGRGMHAELRPAALRLLSNTSATSHNATHLAPCLPPIPPTPRSTASRSRSPARTAPARSSPSAAPTSTWRCTRRRSGGRGRRPSWCRSCSRWVGGEGWRGGPGVLDMGISFKP